jgi:hypothetical protein
MKIPEYERGWNDASGEMIAWLQAEARAMNDPHARAILNGAAFGLGVWRNSPEVRARVATRARHSAGKSDEAV